MQIKLLGTKIVIQVTEVKFGKYQFSKGTEGDLLSCHFITGTTGPVGYSLFWGPVGYSD
jgi:hypothetical protein